MATVKTLTHTCPVYEGWLFISLCMGDGGDGFTDEEIEEAKEFLQENNIFNLVEISEPQGGEVECVFVLN